jgi:hypothetical protein
LDFLLGVAVSEPLRTELLFSGVCFHKPHKLPNFKSPAPMGEAIFNRRFKIANTIRDTQNATRDFDFPKSKLLNDDKSWSLETPTSNRVQRFAIADFENRG